MGHYADKFKGKITSDFLKLYLNTAETKDFPREYQLLPLQPTPSNKPFYFPALQLILTEEHTS